MTPPNCDMCSEPMALIKNTVDARKVRLRMWGCVTCEAGEGESEVFHFLIGPAITAQQAFKTWWASLFRVRSIGAQTYDQTWLEAAFEAGWKAGRGEG